MITCFPWPRNSGRTGTRREEISRPGKKNISYGTEIYEKYGAAVPGFPKEDG